MAHCTTILPVYAIMVLSDDLSEAAVGKKGAMDTKAAMYGDGVINCSSLTDECSTSSEEGRSLVEESHAEQINTGNGNHMMPSDSETLAAEIASSSHAPKVKNKRSLLWTPARTLLLDIPLVLVFGTFLFLCWVHHVHDNYLFPQIKAATWSPARDTTDMTYYYRYCDETDLSTTNAQDLYLSDDATPDDAYQHQLRHGFTVFPGVLSQETATNLRNYVISKNRNLTEEESIWLIEWNHRWSFCLGTEEPSVAKAVMELASNQRLKQSMAKILGENPALIELTSITSSYGARAQEFHHDGRTNLAQYAQGVSHAYSIFIMLQNTTKNGGATGACPGTHMCADGLEKVCEEHGIQPINQHGYWTAGDAMVMNMDSWHRGSAHVDPGGPDRVMLCVTFTSRPRDRAESRQLPQGISYSLRWDMWGHTWKDLETANTTMKQPWTLLRALGLYKSPSVEWGVDYVNSVSVRMANEYFGFTDDDLKTFVRLGGFKFLPLWLQSEYNKETKWHSFLLQTLICCKHFMQSVSLYSAGVYIFLVSIVGMVFSGLKGCVRRLGCAVFRLAVLFFTVFAMYKAAIKHVDESQWASDLRNGLRYTSPFVGNDVSEYRGLMTMPYRADVLIETRFKSKYLAMLNDFIGNHPGNRLWNALIDEKASIHAKYSGLPSAFSEAVAEYIVSAVYEKAGRILYQSHRSHWLELSREDAVKHAKRELVVKSNSIRQSVIKELEFLISEAKYGPLRNALMMQLDVLPYLLDLKESLTTGVLTQEKKVATAVRPMKKSIAIPQRRPFIQKLVLAMPRTAVIRRLRCPVVLHVGQLPGEPQPNAWLRTFDVVNAQFRQGEKLSLQKATLMHVRSGGICIVIHHVDDKTGFFYCKDLTRYTPPKVGERVEVKVDDNQFLRGIIVNDRGNDLYDVDVSERVYENVSDDVFRRPLNTTDS